MSTTSSSRIQRGRACVPCHLRKKRCDGEQPSCGGCIRSQISCEYVPVPLEPEPMSSIQIRIQTLQSRVEELEATLSNMTVQAPRPSIQPSKSSPRSCLIDPQSGEVAGWLQDILRPTMIANRRHYNLYLDIETLRSPPKPLLHAMNLVASHILSLSADSDTRPTLQELEELKSLLLKQVHSGVHTSLECARDLIAGVVCAPALAAQYLLQVGKFTEAHWLASSAVRFAVSCGLHTIVGHRWNNESGGSSPGSTTSSGSSSTFLVPASSFREHYDRCMSWWLAFSADGIVEIVAKLPSALRPELRACIGDTESGVGRNRKVTASFPLREDVYEGNTHQLEVPSPTIGELLLGGHSGIQDYSMGSMFAMRLKSMAFFEATALLDEDFRAGQSFGPDTRRRIDQSLSRFIETLPGLEYHEPAHATVPQTNDAPINPNIIVTYMLAYSAKIRLHSASPETCLDVALLVGRLASAFGTVPHFGVAPLVVRCCSDALHVITSVIGIHDEQPSEADALRLLLSSLGR
ncbi:GAL4-like Zn(II)2Cys6 (or C6 zinc) binuclear cluster DNA-binding domain, partial [Rhizoctonia solani]